MQNTLNKLIAEGFRQHAKPLPNYVRAKPGDVVHDRFRLGRIDEVGQLPCDDADLVGIGGYCTYAIRTTWIPLVLGCPALTFWKPGLYFLSKDPGRKPELAFDGDPIKRKSRPVPVDTAGSLESIRKKIFAPLTGPSKRFCAFYQQTGQRWEVVVERERRRCAKTGEPFAMPELPLDRRTLS